MADFRKLFLALAVMALLAVPLSADQPTVTCYASSSPVIIRDGGLTELVGDVTLSCDNTAVGAVDVQTDIQIFMNYAQVTNKVLNNTGSGGECPTGIKCVTDAVTTAKWITLGPPPSAAGVNGNPTPIIGLLQSRLDLTGDPANQRNSVLFPRVPVPAGTITIIRISNVRIAAPSVSASGSTDVFEKITTNNVVVTPNYQLPVATVQIPLQFQTTGCDGSVPVSWTFQQCNAHNSSTGSMSTDFNVQFIEGFALAFKPISNSSSGSIIVGNKFLSESGYYFASLTSPGGSAVPDVGLASTGTNLVLRFTNIPSGISIYVTKANVFQGTSQLTATGPPAITASASGTATGTMSCSAITADQGKVAIPVSISGGAGSVSWVVTSIDATFNYQKTIAFGVAVSYVPNTSLDLPGLTGTPGGGVTGALGPISTVDYASPLSSSITIPRFRDNPKGATVFSVNPCVTNILFPYVTVKAGFDTGIALVNTSLDAPVFATQTQHGACTMYYFDGTATAPAAQTTCDIKPGAMVAFSMMSSGGVPSATCADGSTVTNTAVPIGWQGYGIAKCKFQYGRGYAFISDRNVPGLGSQGYLPLILSACTTGRNPNPFDNWYANCGEALAH